MILFERREHFIAASSIGMYQNELLIDAIDIDPLFETLLRFEFVM